MYLPVFVKPLFTDNNVNRFSDREIKGRFLQPDIDFPVKQLAITNVSSTPLTGDLSTFVRMIDGDIGYVGLTSDQDCYYQFGFGPADPIASVTTSPVLWLKQSLFIVPIYTNYRIAARAITVAGTLYIHPMS